MNLTDLKTKPVILIFGKLCSGKGTYAKALESLGYTHVATSDVVKQLCGFAKREDLQNTSGLAHMIADELIEMGHDNHKTVIDGVRQMLIVDRIIRYFGSENVGLIWLEVEREELLRRYLSRGDHKDTQDFDVALQGDEELGLLDIEKWIKNNPNALIVDNNETN